MPRCTRRTANRSRARRQPRLPVLSGLSRMRSARVRRSGFGGSVPGVPCILRGTDRELLLMANERHAEQQRLETELFEPALIAEPSGAEAELVEAARLAIDERGDPEFLREATQLTQRRRTLIQIDEVNLDSPLGKEPQRGPSVGALFHAENLHFHR